MSYAATACNFAISGGITLSGPAFEAVVAGHLCLDMIPSFTGDKMPLSSILIPGKLVDVGPLTTATGGPVSNTGMALHRLGFAVRLMGKVGNDVVGHAILDLVNADGPALAEGMILTDESPSSYTIVINPPGVDRIFLHCPGANDTFTASDIDYEKLDGGRLFHFGYPPLMRRMYADGGSELTSLLERVKQRELTTSLDMARPDPASDAGRADWRSIIQKALPYVDVFLPSFDEILYMLDRPRFDDLEQRSDSGDLNAQADGELLRALADELIEMGAAIVGMKLGTQGFYLRTTSDPARLATAGKCAPQDAKAWLDRELLAPCFVVNVVGTTGSGDSTIAGFLGGLLKDLPPEDVMRAAVAVGACNVEQADSLSGLIHWSRVQERIQGSWQRREVTITLQGWNWDEAKQLWMRL